ncbi:TIGR00255 family protein [Azospira oryzae PS]|uniref:TIGR00255 family protein n=1 Tax=Azospira oryzae (strain ATCC BAA-33 / DSM 13638 / PS) TaxID=640081 RepID=G8QFA1_AZOOP|nr:YicC/YloC family endoribonuclease [Azospira oryzae]AEV24911.1 TIGR00255 family protein [Azospira oryzae PS]
MIYSMTGYAAKTREVAGGSLHLELRSVNSRFLDIHFRIVDDLRVLEPALREAITAKLARGKVELRLNLVASQSQNRQLAINADLLTQLQALEGQVRQTLPNAAALSVAEVLRWPGMLGEPEVDTAALHAAVQATLKEALDDFTASRAREGAKLAAMIQERVDKIRATVAAVAPLIPQAQAAYQDKLKQRLVEALGSADDERVRQEVVLYATRIDVDEELSRLQAHLTEVERILKAGGNAGKRLDFLMQELNREANTLGSKSVLSEVSKASMDLKLLIEQMREQIQNIE